MRSILPAREFTPAGLSSRTALERCRGAIFGEAPRSARDQKRRDGTPEIGVRADPEWVGWLFGLVGPFGWPDRFYGVSRRAFFGQCEKRGKQRKPITFTENTSTETTTFAARGSL